jgi:hypothetical protein
MYVCQLLGEKLQVFNPLNAKLNPICHLLALLEAHPILHISRIRVNCNFADLLCRVVILTGSGLSPWALQQEPLAVKRKVEEQTRCDGDMVEDDLASCLRAKSLSDL